MSHRIIVIWDGSGTGPGHFTYTGDGTTLPPPKHKFVMTDLDSVDWTCVNGISGQIINCEVKFDPAHCHHPNTHACDSPEPNNHLANPQADHDHPYKYKLTIDALHAHDPEIQVESGLRDTTYGILSDHPVAVTVSVLFLVAALLGLYFYRRS